MASFVPARRILVAALLVLTPTLSIADQVFDSWGFNQNRDYFSQLPYEHIDPMTGNLILTFTDLVLPGNAGFDLRIQRSYNSKIYRDYNTSGDTLGEDSWAGVGWTLLIARVLRPDFPDKPIIEMPDGSRHQTYNHVSGDGSLITRDFWVYRRSFPSPVLSLPNGVTYTFGRRATITGLGTVLLATEVRDPFGNRVTVEYATGPTAPPDAIARITQFLGAATRVITFTYQSSLPRRSLQSMTLNAGRTFSWNYTHVDTNSVGYSLLTEVRPPVGPSWRYAYNTATPPRYELTRLTAPAGGQIDYSSADQLFSMPGTFIPIRSRVVTRRNTSGRDIPPGSWSYAYAQGANKNQSVFDSPCGRTTYTFLGIGNFAVGLPAWQIGLLSSKTTYEGPTVLETEQFTWRPSERISFDDEVIGRNLDPEIWVPLVDTRTVTRGGQSYVTRNTYNAGNFNDYGRPARIAETGELSRVSDRTFRYGFAQYIVDKIASETVSVAGESFTKSYAYDLANGFLASETIYGIPVQYSQDGAGNVRSRRDANANTTLFTYSWGLLKDTETPLYTITRVINPEGTVASVTRRGFTTSFQYDALFRIVQTSPPAGNPLFTDYDNGGGAFRRVRRGPSSVTTWLDGFGRPSGSASAVGVNTDINYDACGRVVYESYPFTTANIGSTYQYDALGRRKLKSNPDGSSVQYRYNGIDVDITDEEQRVTRQDWAGLGDPNEARLVALTDARSVITSYGYNALGNLTRAQTTAGPARQWEYNGRNELATEVQPENGTVRYTYDAAGNLKTRTDPQFGRTDFFYDPNNRRIRIDRPGIAHDSDISYDDSDNRTRLANSFVVSTFAYDGSNRLSLRTDAVNGRSYNTGYVYDGNDNIVELRYPSGRRAVYAYDAANRILSVTDGAATTYASLFQYHPSGAPAAFRAGNSLVHSFSYDNRYRLKTLGSGGVLNLTYGYDRVGNVQSIADSRAGMSQSYGYDSLDRLTRADGFWGGGSFSYDNLGNRLTKIIGGRGTSYNYSSGTQRLTSAGGAEPDTFTYDANGNLIGRNGASFAYTPENMMEAATVGAVVTTYAYDGDNLRKQKIGGGKTQYFIHGPANQLVSEFEEPCAGQVRWVRDYIYAGSRLLAATEAPMLETRVELVATASSASEAAGTAPVDVRAVTSNGAPLLCPAGVDYASADGSAQAGLDYTAVSGRLSFAGGTPSGTVQTIPVGLVNDALDELDETFRLSLSGVSGAVLGASEHTVTIVDDDPSPGAAVNDVSVVEGDTGPVNAVFTVSLSAPSALEVRVDYATVDGTAQAPSDYGAAAGTLVFAPGTTSQTVSVAVVGDTRYEADETFRLNLLNPVNATLSDADGVGTILNDDPQPSGVRFFTATSTSGQVKLEWVNPSEEPYRSTMVRYRAVPGSSACSFPTLPTEGELLVSQAGSLGAHDSFLHGGLLNDNTTYCYAAFVELEPGLFSRGRTSKGRPFDSSGPVKWAYSTGATTVEPPGLGPGAYAGSNDSILHGIARGAAGGDWLSGWTHVLLGGPVQSRPPVVPTNLIAGATQVVFVSSQDGYVYAVNAETGAVPWRSPERLGESVQAAVSGMFRAFGGAYDYLLVGTRNATGANQFYALNPADGTVVGAPFDNGGGANGIGIISGQASVDYQGKRVFFASRALAGGSPNTVWCLNLTETGLAFGWAVAVADIDGSPTLNNGRVYVGTNQGVVSALDANDGQVLWSFPVGEPVKGYIFPDRRTDRLYFSTTTKVWGLTFGSSEPNWPPVTLPGPSTALFTPGGTWVLVGAGDGRLYQLDVANAGPAVPPEVRSVVLGDGLAAVGSPTLDVANVLVYVGTESGFIYAVEIPLR